MSNIWIIILSVIGFLCVALLAFFLVRLLIRQRKERADGLYWHYQNMWLYNAFENYDTAVYGFRGTGKDVIFAHAINLQAKPHYSNIWYNEQSKVTELKELHVGGNSYHDFINGNIQKFIPNFEEEQHFYISDAGVYLACQYNKELNTCYGELPIHVALRRHLYNSHVHTNSQALNRVWDKLREQQGCFIHCLKTHDYGAYLVVETITYTHYESALACLPPPEKEDKYHTLKYGEIVERRFRVPKETLLYNSRHFKTILHKGGKEK